jgi:hypothetical protein
MWGTTFLMSVREETRKKNKIKKEEPEEFISQRYPPPLTIHPSILFGPAQIWREQREKEKEDGQKGDDDETKWRRGTTTS